MAKKARRKKQSVLTQAQLTGTTQQDHVSAEKVVVQVQVQETAAKGKVDFAQEYRYVITDLERIGMLAAVMLAVLVVLNLVLK